MDEELSSGSPYKHRACKCATCLRIYEAHNIGNMGLALNCVCSGCNIRRQNKQPWGFIPESPRVKAPFIPEVPRVERVKKVATINLCEREGCGAMFKSNVAGSANVSTMDKNGYGVSVFVGEICPACVGDLARLLQTSPTEPRNGKAFSEPWTPDASKSEAGNPLAGLSDLELAEELVKRSALNIAHELTTGEERPQDD